MTIDISTLADIHMCKDLYLDPLKNRVFRLYNGLPSETNCMMMKCISRTLQWLQNMFVGSRRQAAERLRRAADYS